MSKGPVAALLVVGVGGLCWAYLARESEPERRIDSASLPASPTPTARPEVIVESSDVKRCLDELKRVREATVTISATGESVPVKTLGRLTTEQLSRSTDELRSIAASTERQLRKLMTDGPQDLRKEARLLVAIETCRAEIDQLESGNYVLLEPGAIDRVWPESPEGSIIMNLDTVRIADGRAADVIIPVEIDDHPSLAEVVDYKKVTDAHRAQEAAYAFNGLSDAERTAAVAEYDTIPEKSSHGVVMIRRARYGGFNLDRRRSLLVQ